MGIKVNVSTNQDSSYLFQSLSSGGMGNLNFLSDYASIKNGSYGKLMKSYYGTGSASSVNLTGSKTSSTTASGRKDVLEEILEAKKNPKVSKDTQKSNAELTSGLSSLSSSVSALQSDKTYTDTANGQSATDKVVSAMKDYVKNYNNVVKAAKGSTLSGKTAYVANMMSSTSRNADKLAEIGIGINSDGTIELNEGKLKAADISKVQDLFSTDNIMSYGSTVASRLQFAGSTNGTDAADNTETSATAASSAASLKEDSRTLASDELYAMMKDKDGNETDKYDVDKIFATAKSFVNNYNNMFAKAESSTNSGVLANLSYIREKTAHNAETLKQFGISVDEKGKMKIDEDTIKNSDMSKVQNFFKDYGSSIATNASLVDYYMTTQASAASGYTDAGAYNVQGSARYDDMM